MTDVHKKLSTTNKTILIVLLVLGILACALSLFSPFEYTHNLIDNQNFEKAIKVSTLGTKLTPKNTEWYALRGYAYFQTDNYEEAIKDYDMAYKLESDNENIMNFDNKIFIKYYLDDFDSAIKDFDTEISNALDDNIKDQFLWDKAQFLFNIKRYNEALAIYNDLIVKAENDRIFLLKDRLYLERAQVYKKLNRPELAEQDILYSGISDSQNPIPKPMLMLDEETFYSY